MKEVQRLIHEGPIIQQTTAGLPHLLERQRADPQHASVGHRKVTDEAPADKRARTSFGDSTTGAEDAEALVGFLNSVRASAEGSGHGFSA